VKKEIRVRYLWVDSLCTVQDGDVAEHLEQIESLDIIYAAVHLAITAVGSVSENACIVGV